MGTAVGRDDMTEEQIRQNLNMSINFLVSLLKKGWNNIKSLTIKTSMGKPVRIYGWEHDIRYNYSFIIIIPIRYLLTNLSYKTLFLLK